MCKTKYPDLEDLVKALEKEYDEQKQIQKFQHLENLMVQIVFYQEYQAQHR